MKTIRISLKDNSYDVYIGKGLLERVGELLQPILPSSKVMLVADPIVYRLYGQKCIDSLCSAGFQVAESLIKVGEESKSLEQAQKLYGAALAAGLDRKSTFLALGGGVTGDLTGFVAATYLRGTGYVQLPTTLLAQVDSSVGGKVAVNLPQGKNLVGAFHQPLAVLADTSVLFSLPARHIKAGLGEVIKYGIIWDEVFFNYLEENISCLLTNPPEPTVLAKAIARSVEIKAEIVGRDEKEGNLRRVLNFGHTYGHALEAATNYQAYYHGEAVMAGMAMAAKLAARQKICPVQEAERIISLLKKIGLPPLAQNLQEQLFWSAFARDKKREGSRIVLVLPYRIGRVGIFLDLPFEPIKESLAWYGSSFTREEDRQPVDKKDKLL